MGKNRLKKDARNYVRPHKDERFMDDLAEVIDRHSVNILVSMDADALAHYIGRMIHALHEAQEIQAKIDEEFNHATSN